MTRSRAAQRLLRWLRLPKNLCCISVPSCGNSLPAAVPNFSTRSGVLLMEASAEHSWKGPALEETCCETPRRKAELHESDASPYENGLHTGISKRFRVECLLPHAAAQFPARRLSSTSHESSAIPSTCPRAGYATGATTQGGDNVAATTCDYQGAQAYYDLLTKGKWSTEG